MRATRKALDLIEDEVGRPINFHSYVSGVAGPEMAVMFAEEGVNGAHQDPQYNVLYRNINMYRSFVDAAVAKHVMASVRMVQIDGAHNANATAREAWKVMPELLVQHAINCAYSVVGRHAQGGHRLSTVPPDAAPAPCMRMDLPYAVALRDLFGEYKMRAQQNTRYMESDGREATVSHVHEPDDLAAHQRRHPVAPSRPTRAATCRGTTTTCTPSTPPGSRSWAWTACARSSSSTARTPSSRRKVRELKERAVLFLEAMIARRRLLRRASRRRYFVDSGEYPETNDDGIVRYADGGVAAGTIVERADDYLAPVCHHFGDNHLPEGRRASRATSSAAARSATATRCRSSTSSTPRTTSTSASAQTAELREQGPHQARGRVGRRRHRRRHDVPAGAPSASPSSPRSSSARR